jgi:hypothetical protein
MQRGKYGPSSKQRMTARQTYKQQCHYRRLLFKCFFQKRKNGDKDNKTMIRISYNHTAKDQFCTKNQKNDAIYYLILSPFSEKRGLVCLFPLFSFQKEYPYRKMTVSISPLQHLIFRDGQSQVTIRHTCTTKVFAFKIAIIVMQLYRKVIT